MVGGAVRDRLLDIAYKEKDWVVVNGSAAQLIKKGFKQVGKSFPVFLHPKTKEEYALAREEKKTAQKGHCAFTCNTDNVSLEDDLKRRDLTINAIAFDANDKLIDPYNGLQDIKDRTLRHVSDAFIEDPLRVFRVARFMSQLGNHAFTVHPDTLTKIQEMIASGEHNDLSKERIWTEMHKALSYPHAKKFFITLQQCNALKELFPYITAENLNALQLACQTNSPTIVRFALIAFNEHASATDYIKLAVPKKYTDLVNTLNQHYSNYCHALKLDCSQLLTFLNQLDAIRRPERFSLFLLTCEVRQKARSPEKTNLEITPYLRKAIQIIKDTDLTKITKSSGKDISKEIFSLRLKTLQETLFNH